MPYVCESIVIENAKGKLIALIYPDFENLERQHIADNDILKLMKDNVAHLNKDLPAYSQLSDIKIQTEEFEKTPKRSIKRFLYQHKY